MPEQRAYDAANDEYVYPDGRREKWPGSFDGSAVARPLVPAEPPLPVYPELQPAAMVASDKLSAAPRDELQATARQVLDEAKALLAQERQEERRFGVPAGEVRQNPTIGRIVLVIIEGETFDGQQECPALITRVRSDQSIDVIMFPCMGHQRVLWAVYPATKHPRLGQPSWRWPDRI